MLFTDDIWVEKFKYLGLYLHKQTDILEDICQCIKMGWPNRKMCQGCGV